MNSTFQNWTPARDQLKTKNWSADNFKKMSCKPEPAIQSRDTGQRIPFLTALTITWMSNTKFNTGSIYFGLLASIKVCHFTSTNMKGWTYVRTYE